MDKFESDRESVYSEKNNGQIVGKNVKPLKKSKLPTKSKNPSYLQAQGVSLIDKQSCIAPAPNHGRVCGTYSWLSIDSISPKISNTIKGGLLSSFWHLICLSSLFVNRIANSSRFHPSI
ncbi:hypothetical protein [Brevibacillus porteri]|uniref:hypothetical protein n=1 Tax=Brevibacillus porteri TaxID=2126350 RepID=UPI003D2046A8